MVANITQRIDKDVLFISILSIFVFFIGASSIIEKSPTWDEPFYLGAGYYYGEILGSKMLSMTHSHPPLSYYVNSIPIYIFSLAYPDFFIEADRHYKPLTNRLCHDIDCVLHYSRYAYKLIYDDHYKEYEILFFSRCSMMILLVICIIYLFRFVKELYGFETAGIICTLFALNPNIIAHSRLVTTDIAPVSFSLIASYYFIKFINKRDLKNSLKVGFSLGLALLSKLTAIYLLPAFVITIILYSGVYYSKILLKKVISNIKKGIKYDWNTQIQKYRDRGRIKQRTLFFILLFLSLIIAVKYTLESQSGYGRMLPYNIILIIAFLSFKSSKNKESVSQIILGSYNLIRHQAILFANNIISLIRESIPYLIIGLIAILTINAGYQFQEVNLDGFKIYSGIGEKDEYRKILGRMTYGLPLPISDYYLMLLDSTNRHINISSGNYFKGRLNELGSSKKSIAEYWGLTFFYKTPEGTIGLLIISLFYYLGKIIHLGSSTTPRIRLVRNYSIVNILVFIIIAININILIGIRLILIIFPFIYILMAEPIKHLLTAKHGRYLVYALTIISLFSTATIHPHYIAYFNTISGGPENGYKIFSDSNLDWGQDLPGLKKYMDDNGIPKIKLSYYGMGKIEEYGIEYTSLPNNQPLTSYQRKPDIGCGPTTGLIAISAISLTNDKKDPECYGWLKEKEPIDMIGYSILIYNITG